MYLHAYDEAQARWVPVTPAMLGGGGGGGGGDASAANQTAQITAANLANTRLASLVGLDIPAHDHIGLTYEGSDISTVTYRSGGPSGTVVATLTLTYSAGNLVGVSRS